MKQLLVVLFTITLLASCDNINSGVELRLDGILACGNPDLDINHGQTEEWQAHVLNYLANEGFSVLSSRLDHEEINREGLWCGNCWPTGDQLFVTVPEEEQSGVEALGFYVE